MLSRNQVKYVNSLKLKKYREEMGRFIAEGSKLVLDLMESAYPPTEIFATMEWLRTNRSALRESAPEPLVVTESEMGRITALATPGPVLGIFPITQKDLDPASFAGKLILAIDEIRDPGNLGTIIRIADWFGIDAIICSGSTVDLYNPKVVQSTMGSIARVPVHYTDLQDLLSALPSSTLIYGTFMEGENIYTAGLQDSGVIIIGNESTGISPEVARFIRHKLHIPFFTGEARQGSHAESLNASVAAAIVCSEFRRRSLQTG